jgi:hypothetical protein
MFLVPTISVELIEAHQAFHRRLSGVGVHSMPYYKPGNWVPHCTAAMDLALDKLSPAMEVCRNSSTFGRVRLSAAGLVSVGPTQELYTFPVTGDGACK